MDPATVRPGSVKAARMRLAGEQPGPEAYQPSLSVSPLSSPLPAGREASTVSAPDVYWSDEASANPTNFTFYREGTPTPQNYGDDHEKRSGRGAAASEDSEAGFGSPGEGRDEDGENTICGFRSRLFWGALAAIIVLIVGLAVGVGVGVSFSRHISSSQGDAAAASSSSSSSPSATVPATTATSSPPATSASTSASSSSATPTASANCPDGNGTVYQVPGSDKKFLRLCGIDYSGSGEAVDLSHVLTSSFSECMDNCAGTPACTGCGWGAIKGDTGTEHRCWMKDDLQKPHKAAKAWSFAILQ